MKRRARHLIADSAYVLGGVLTPWGVWLSGSEVPGLDGRALVIALVRTAILSIGSGLLALRLVLRASPAERARLEIDAGEGHGP
jgi:hypothetical protein